MCKHETIFPNSKEGGDDKIPCPHLFYTITKTALTWFQIVTSLSTRITPTCFITLLLYKCMLQGDINHYATMAPREPIYSWYNPYTVPTYYEESELESDSENGENEEEWSEVSLNTPPPSLYTDETTENYIEVEETSVHSQLTYVEEEITSTTETNVETPTTSQSDAQREGGNVCRRLFFVCKCLFPESDSESADE